MKNLTVAIYLLSYFLTSSLAVAQQSYSSRYGGGSNYYAAEAAQRAENQRAMSRQYAVEAAQRAENQRAMSRHYAAEAAQRAENQRAISRQYAAEAAQRAEVQRSISRQNSYEAAQRSQSRSYVGHGETVIIGGGYYSPGAEQSYLGGDYPEQGTISPQPRVSRQRAQIYSIDSGVVAINGQPVPRGATHYYYDGQTIHFGVPKAEATNLPPEPTPIHAAPKVLTPPKIQLPQVRYPGLYAKFFNQPEVANHAYLELVDEPIGPQAVDSLPPEFPAISDALANEVTRDRFSTIKALFDNAALPDLPTIGKNSGWVGRCVYRSSPQSEVGALLGLSVEGQTTRAAILTTTTATDLLASPTLAQANKYDLMQGNSVIEIKSLLAASDPGLSILASTPLEDRPLTRDSVFFDQKGESGGGSSRRGFRLRIYVAPTGKRLLVAEGYAPFKEGSEFVGKTVAYLEAIQYCYFKQPWDWK